MAVKCGICCRCGNTSPAHPLHTHLSGRHRLQHPTTTAGNRGKCCRCGSTSPYTPASQTPLGPTPATAPNHNGRESREMLPLQYKKGEKQHHKRPAPIYNPDTPSEGVLLSRKIPTPSEGVHKAHTHRRHTEGHFPRMSFHKEKPSYAGSRYSTISWNRYRRALTSFGSLGSISLPLSSVMLMPVTSMPEVTKPIGSSM